MKFLCNFFILFCILPNCTTENLASRIDAFCNQEEIFDDKIVADLMSYMQFVSTIPQEKRKKLYKAIMKARAKLPKNLRYHQLIAVLYILYRSIYLNISFWDLLFGSGIQELKANELFELFNYYFDSIQVDPNFILCFNLYLDGRKILRPPFDHAKFKTIFKERFYDIKRLQDVVLEPEHKAVLAFYTPHLSLNIKTWLCYGVKDRPEPAFVANMTIMELTYALNTFPADVRMNDEVLYVCFE